MHTSNKAVQKLQAAGRSSYLTKVAAVEKLCRAIEEAVSHQE